MLSAEVVLALTRSRPPTLGGGRLLCIDGPAGSGKTTLAAALARLEPSARVIHMDDLYDGWDGLPRVTDQLDDLLLPLAAGKPGSYRRYDWVALRFGERVTVPPSPLLVLEGVGSGSASHAHLVTALAWVFAVPELRLARGLARDGSASEGQWRQWMLDEAEHHTREGTRVRADVVVDGTGASPPEVVDRAP